MWVAPTASDAKPSSAVRQFTLADDHARDLFDASPDLVFARDRSFHFLFVNRAYAEFIGSTPEQMVGRLDTDFWHVAKGDALATDSRASDEAALAGQTLRRTRVEMSRGGARRIFDVHKVPLRDARGEVYGLLSSAREVTDTFLAEEALRASEERYRSLLEHAPVALFVHDGKTILFANQTFAELLGAANPAAVLGYPVAKVPHPDDAAGVSDMQVTTLSGTSVPVQAIATKCTFEGKAAIQVVMLDETAPLAAQSEREALEIHRRHTQRLEALGTLAGGIAHDFNNMLAVIVANAELARREVAGEHPAHASLDEVLRATDRASALVRGILAFSQKEPLERTPVRLVDLVQDAARLLRATLPAAIALEVETDRQGHRIIAHATQLHQAVTNLCTNAWQSMSNARAGRIRIAIQSVVVDEGAARRLPQLTVGNYACISVSDNGSGMDADTTARVFDPFFTTKAPGEGTGLGLSIVHGIMRGHGGAVTVSSELGVGTEVRLYFPAIEAPAEKAPSTPAAATVSVVGARILLVDDEPAFLTVLRRTLELDGFKVTAKSSFTEAMAALREDHTAYDVIVSDYNMPEGSGIELATTAKQLRPGLPVILMSGYLDDRVRQRALDVGVVTLLGKPFPVKELVDAVELALASNATATT